MVDTSTALATIQCSGNPFEIGLAHGRQARIQIATTVARWSELIAGNRDDVSDYLARFLHATNIVPAIEKHAPDLLTDLRGIAEGAQLPFETILAYHLMDEEWSYRTGTLSGVVPGCTAVALADVGIGQTMDIPDIHDGTQVALHITPESGPEKIVFSVAGMLGLNGANRSGVGVVVNNLSQLPSAANGLPVIVVMRGILECESAARAAEWAESVPHAIGQHYLICDATEIVSVEAAANGVFRVPVPERYVHANHPLANPASATNAAEQEIRSNTRARADRATELIADARDQSSIETILEDRQAPISCARSHGFMTIGGTSIGIGAPPTVRITSGPPHESSWTSIDWNQPA